MADKTEYDWSGVTASAVNRLRVRKPTPVPDKIKELAQASYDGIPSKEDPESKLHVLRHRFGSDEEAAAFARLMRKAGDHTTPPTSVSVVIDPDEQKDLRVVAWKAGQRRGRGSAKAA